MYKAKVSAPITSTSRACKIADGALVEIPDGETP